MRKLVYFVAASVDGFIAGPHGEFDFFPLAGEHIVAQGRALPETFPKHVREALGITSPASRFDTVVMGRNTYRQGLDAGFADPYAPLRTIVFSTTLPAASHGTLRVTGEDPLAVVRALKAEDGADIWLCGGGMLAQSLAPLVDELFVKLNPVVVHRGTPLWGGAFAPQAMQLTSSRVFPSGVVWLHYAIERAV